MGIFNSIRPGKYPHVQTQFVIFAQLISGLGAVPFYLDVRVAATGQLVNTTNTHLLNFPHRDRVVQLNRVLDASVALKWVLPEPSADKALQRRG